MWNEFKKFAMRGNVLDLAVGIILGAAFNKIVSSFVSDIILPIVGIILGRVNISSLVLVLGPVSIKYGNFLQNIFDFLLTAFGVFIIIKGINKFNSFKKAEEEKVIPVKKASKEEELLKEIRDILAASFSDK